MSSIGLVVAEEKMFENVGGRRMDDRVTGKLLAHQWALGSVELIKRYGQRDTWTMWKQYTLHKKK